MALDAGATWRSDAPEGAGREFNGRGRDIAALADSGRATRQSTRRGCAFRVDSADGEPDSGLFAAPRCSLRPGLSQPRDFEGRVAPLARDQPAFPPCAATTTHRRSAFSAEQAAVVPAVRPGDSSRCSRPGSLRRRALRVSHRCGQLSVSAIVQLMTAVVHPSDCFSTQPARHRLHLRGRHSAREIGRELIEVAGEAISGRPARATVPIHAATGRRLRNTLQRAFVPRGLASSQPVASRSCSRRGMHPGRQPVQIGDERAVHILRVNRERSRVMLGPSTGQHVIVEHVHDDA